MKVCNFSNDIIHLNSFNYSDNYLKKNKKINTTLSNCRDSSLEAKLQKVRMITSATSQHETFNDVALRNSEKLYESVFRHLTEHEVSKSV
jgi:hypothetical protein